MQRRAPRKTGDQHPCACGFNQLRRRETGSRSLTAIGRAGTRRFTETSVRRAQSRFFCGCGSPVICRFRLAVEMWILKVRPRRRPLRRHAFDRPALGGAGKWKIDRPLFEERQTERMRSIQRIGRLSLTVCARQPVRVQPNQITLLGESEPDDSRSGNKFMPPSPGHSLHFSYLKAKAPAGGIAGGSRGPAGAAGLRSEDLRAFPTA